MDSAHRKLRDRDGDRERFAATRGALAYRRPANDNRLGLGGWITRLAALTLLIALATLLAWKAVG